MEVPSNAKDVVLETHLKKVRTQKYGINFLFLLSNSVSSQTMMNKLPYAEREMV